MICYDDDDDDDDQIRVVPSNPAFSERHTGHAPSYKYLYSHASGSGCGFLASSVVVFLLDAFFNCGRPKAGAKGVV